MSDLGVYYDGKSPQKYMVNIVFHSNGIEGIYRDTKFFEWDYSSIIIHDTGSTDINCIVSICNSDARLHLNYFTYCKLQSKLPTLVQYSKIKSQKFRKLLIVLSSLLIIIVGGYFCLPLFSDKIARIIPFQIERNIGNRVFSSYVSNKSMVNNQEKIRILNKVVDKLISTDYYKKNYFPDVKLYISKSNEINAFAFPGGIIVLNSELINSADSIDEIAGVIAHELGHVISRHSMQSLITNIGIYATIGHIFGDYGVPTLLVEGSHSRDMEREADDVALLILEQANVNPLGFINFLGKNKNSLSEQYFFKYMSTHPISSERIDMLNYNNNKKFINIITEQEWHILKSN